MIAQKVNRLGQRVLQSIDGSAKFTRFAWATAAWTVRPAGWLRGIMAQFYYVGTGSIPVVVLVGAFVGMVLGIETFDQLAMLGLESRLGGLIDISVVKQIGPVLTAVMIAGRVGGAVSAELGTMRVTEQLDALEVMGADPVAYLVVPRVLACVVMVPVLTVFSDLMGIFGGWLVVVVGLGVEATAYWQFAADFVSQWDVLTGLSKSVVFGLGIGLIACYKGFHCKAGAAGVGRAATDAFVTSFIMIIITNFFLATLFKDLYSALFGPAINAFTG